MSGAPRARDSNPACAVRSLLLAFESEGGSFMIAITISLMASAAVVQPQAGSGPAPSAEMATTAQSQPAESPDLYSEMVHAAAEVARRGELPIDDSTDHARRMAGSDRNKERYFNRPGATDAEYQHEWTGCRQIARRLASPSGNLVWMQSGFIHGGIIGGLLIGGLDAGFSRLRARRDIRRQCLIARGWRMVEPDEAGQARIAALSRDDREAYFDRMLGATEVEPGATITDRASLRQGAGGANHRGGRDDEGE
jgi:hypothetical protein